MFISPKVVLQDFLRNNLTDPQSRAEETKTETFDGDATEYTLNPDSGKKFYAIKSVKVEGTTKSKWKDYYIDMQNSKVIFFSTTPSGTGNVEIEYKQGQTNWIYTDKPRQDLSSDSFPRVSITSLGGQGERVGQYNSNIQTAIPFQIDIWTKENQVFEIENHKYEGDKLGEYLAYKITKAFEDNENEIHPQLYNYTLLQSPRDLEFDKEIECFHTIVEIELNSLDAGEQ
ncbi:MAG: hypothetical protein ACOC5T_07235 [Elusimicrobiota bacterium]